MEKSDFNARYNIGEHIRLARKSLGLRQTDLAKMAGLPASHLSDMERGVAIPTIPTLFKVAEALNRPLEYFFQEISDHSRSLGIVFHESSIGGRAVSEFVRLAKEKSQGAVDLHIFQQASLGSARDQVQSLSQGGIHLFIDEPLSFECFSPLCGTVFLPYFFSGRDHYYRFLESPLFESEIFQPLLNQGIRLLNPGARWEGGNFELLFSQEPIFVPGDLRGKKMRTYASETARSLRRALGAEPVTVEWENVYAAFEQGDIDVLLCPSSYFSVLKLHKIAKYATILRYGYTVNLNVAVSEKEYAKLRPSVQKALTDAVAAAGIYCSDLANRQTETDLEKLSKTRGIPVIQPDTSLWRTAFETAIQTVCQTMPGDLFTGIRQL